MAIFINHFILGSGSVGGPGSSSPGLGPLTSRSRASAIPCEPASRYRLAIGELGGDGFMSPDWARSRAAWSSTRALSTGLGALASPPLRRMASRAS